MNKPKFKIKNVKLAFVLLLIIAFVIFLYAGYGHENETIFLFAAVVLLYASVLWVIFGTIRSLSDENKKYHYINLPSPNITKEYTTVPVIGEIAAGFEHIAIEDWEGDTVDVPDSCLKGRNKSDFFVLRVKGNSMYPEYREDDKVLILKQPTVNFYGQVAAVIYNDDCGTLKKVEYKEGEDWIRLVPINPSIPPILLKDEQLDHFRILGIPRLLIREYD